MRHSLRRLPASISLRMDATLDERPGGNSPALISISGWLIVYGGSKFTLQKQKRMWCTLENNKFQIWKNENITGKTPVLDLDLEFGYHNLESENKFSIRLPHLMTFVIDEPEKSASDWIAVLNNWNISQPWTPELSKTQHTPHYFVKTSFKQATWCSFCKKFIWGLVYQGYECSACGYICHLKCLNEVHIQRSVRCGEDNISKENRAENRWSTVIVTSPRAKADSFSYSSSFTPEIDYKNLVIGKLIGTGAFGKVYAGSLQGKSVAIKIFEASCETSPNWESFLENFRKEIVVMSKSQHPNILLYIGACTSIPGKLMIVTEKCRIDLSELLVVDSEKKIPDFGTINILKMAKDIATAMSFLHSRDPVFLHLDLKPANILLTDNGVVKVADFGETLMKGKFQDTLKIGPRGTPSFMAPELINGGKANKAADIYSFGILLYEIVYQKPAYPITPFAQFCRAICEQGERPTIRLINGKECNPTLKALMQNCWDGERTKRPSFPDIINSLNTIILEYCIADSKGRKFWKEQFYNKETKILQEEILWKDFITSWTNKFPLKSNELYSLQAILAQPKIDLTQAFTPQKYVFLEHFGKVLDWFGPIEQVSQRIHQVVSCRCFHGDISDTEAEYLLRIHPYNDSYLLRCNSSFSGGFVFSAVHGEDLKHDYFIYNRETQTFIFQEEEYDSIQSIIQKNREKLKWINLIESPFNQFLKKEV